MDQIIQENIRLKKKLYNDSINEKINEFYKQIDLEKQQQPIIDIIKKEGEENRKVLEELKPKGKNILSISPGTMGSRFLAKSRVDNLNPFLRLVNKQVYLRNTPVYFIGDNLVIDEKIIPMNENLYKLITRDKDIDYEDLTEEEKNTYYELATSLNFFDKGIGSGGYKSRDYKIFKRIRQDKKFIKDSEEEYEGEGIIKDPKYLLNRLKLLLASSRAGNTGVINEISDILKYLYETNNLSKNKFTKLTKQFFSL